MHAAQRPEPNARLSMLRSATVLFLTAAAAAMPPSPPQPSCAGARLVAEPARPRQGTLFRVRVDGAPSGASLRGNAAGESLHFTTTSPRGAGARVAFAAAPIDAVSPLHVTVTCAVEGRVDSLRAAIALAAADYPLERLRVAPRFSAPPDSALAA